MKKLKQLLIAFSFVSPAWGKTIVLRAPNADGKDYRAYVLSSPVFEFPSHHIVEHFPTPADRDRLAELFAKAQVSYTSGSLIQAIDDYKKVADLATVDHWRREDQTVFLHTFLRLAQLSHDPAQSELWMDQAIVWAKDGDLNENLFPPPMLEAFLARKSTHPQTHLDLSRFVGDFDAIAINGHVVFLKDQSSLSVPAGPARVTFLSNAFQPITLQTTTEQIAKSNPQKRPWIDGNCLKNQSSWQFPGTTTETFFSRQCSLSKPDQTATINIARDVGIPAALPISTEKTKSPFYERSWFWVGVGAIAAAIFIAQASSQRPTATPTNHDGF